MDDADQPVAGPPGDLGDLARWPTGRVLSTAARLVEHAWDDALRAWDLNHARYAVLALLLPGAATQRDLARRAGVEEQTMGRILRHMEEHGHVERHRDPDDRRRTVVTATARGRTSFAEVAAAVDVERLVLDPLHEAGADAEAFRAALVLVVRHLAGRRWGAPRPASAASDAS